VAGVNPMLRHMALGERRWTKNPAEAGVVKGLVEKAKIAMNGREGWKTCFLVFSKSGFTSAAQEFAGQIEKQTGEAEWRAAGLLMLKSTWRRLIPPGLAELADTGG
jgi:hypothetical protein